MVSAGVITLATLIAATGLAQDKRPERIRVGDGSASAAQMSIWFAKEGN
jgi:hypothetical protein